MACRPMGRTIAGAVVRLMVGADRIVRTDSRSVQRAFENLCKSRCGSDEAAQRTLRTGGRSIDENAAALGCAVSAAQCIDSLFERACRITAICESASNFDPSPFMVQVFGAVSEFAVFVESNRRPRVIPPFSSKQVAGQGLALMPLGSLFDADSQNTR